ncbi:helix-turn-helix domain-containing protein [Actinomadura nitritigenes]|uniref:helix-turn-helix domain-containing protein n=1 Tax=Actinomadura nitritigenes TaxID=134602 RepID=UPI003D908AC6
MTNPNPLSDALRTLRRASGLSGIEAARRAGLSQSKISRAETGRFLLSEDDLEALCRVYGAPAEERRQLLEMTRELKASTTSARTVLQRGGWWMQERIGRMESTARRIRSFSPGAVFGLVQSPAYIEALYGDSLAPDDLARTVQARLGRQRILDTDREFTFVMAEGALRWCMGGPAVMAAQLDHLAEISHRPNIHIGIITWTTPATVPGLHPFTLYDSQAVLLGTWNATAIITDQRNIADYEAYWDELQPLISWGDDARAAIARAAQDYRQLTE